MVRTLITAVVALVLLPAAASGQGILRGTLTKVDVEKREVVVKIDGKDQTYGLTEETRVFDAPGNNLAERLKGFRPGAAVMVKPIKRDGREVLEGIKLADAQPQQPAPSRVLSDTSALKPLTELGRDKYQGFAGGLYPNGENARPSEHEAAGLRLVGAIQPLNAEGKPDEKGRIVLLSVGMSNTSQLSNGFEGALRSARGVNPRFQFVNGAQGGMTAAAIQNPKDGGRGEQYWTM